MVIMSGGLSLCLSLSIALVFVFLLLVQVCGVGSQAINDCVLSFNSFEQQLLAESNMNTVAHMCPGNCTDATATLILLGHVLVSVYGQYPYHGESSICLSAIHCGIINDTTGGGVFVSRFYRQDWSNTSTQTIFPNQSYMGSNSNGIQSVDVPSNWYHSDSPSPANEWSYIPRGRGDFFLQNRRAPFSPRAGHLHKFIALPDVSPGGWSAPGYVSYHLIIGGYNATHYLNDVWIVTDDIRGNSHPRSLGDISWRQLPNAPFTPRADMQYYARMIPFAYEVSQMMRYEIWILGGQTDHRCGLRELGVCSNEVWILEFNITRTQTTDTISSFNWTTTTQPATLPFMARCGMTLLEQVSHDTWDRQTLLLLLVGGQDSYTDDNCQSATTTHNDVWSVFGTQNSLDPHAWARMTDAAPFSPRRSVVTDDAMYFEVDPRHSTPQPWLSFVGGMRLHTFTYDAKTNASRVTAIQVMADAWRCQLVEGEQYCAWSILSDPSDTPYSSIPLPISGVPSVTYGVYKTGISGSTFTYPEFSFQQLSLRIGGFTARAMMTAWSNTPPILDDQLNIDPAQLFMNVSMLIRSIPNYDLDNNDITDDRQYLPLFSMMLDEELNDGNGEYQLGSDIITAHTTWIDRRRRPLSPAAFPAASTVHPQSWSLSSSPELASIYVPQAADDINTTRPVFSFAPRRLYHGAAYWVVEPINTAGRASSGVLYLSGGRSGQTYYRDWITLTEIRCLAPTDPSFWSTLGTVRMYEDPNNAFPNELNSYPQKATVLIGCQSGYHLEPPTRDQRVAVICAPNGIWMDSEALTIRKCSRDVLNCTYPFIDLGASECSVPSPMIHSISATSNGLPVDRLTNLTLINLPMTTTTLSIRGTFFSHPLHVYIGGHSCLLPELRDISNVSSYVICEQLTEGEVCSRYANEIACEIPGALMGLNLPVVVVSGHYGLIPETDNAQLVLISSTPPVITQLLPLLDQTEGVITCKEAMSPLHLAGCPITEPFDIIICLSRSSSLPTSSSGQHDMLFFLAAVQLDCPIWQSSYPYAMPPGSCGPAIQCHVTPRLGDDLPLTVRYNRSSAALLQSQQDASLSFDRCPAGTRIDYASAITNSSAVSLCVSCPVGSSTMNGTAQAQCQPCAAGYYSNKTGSALCSACPIGSCSPQTNASSCLVCPPGSSTRNDSAQATCELCRPGYYVNTSGAADCVPCPMGTYQDIINATICQPCSSNSWQRYPGQTRCDTCDLNTYIIYMDQDYQTRDAAVASISSSSSTTANELASIRTTNRSYARCEPCPAMADCDSTGTITAASGAYLLIDQVHATVSTVPCSVSVCLSADSNTCVNTPPQYITASQLVVSNCCADGRLAAIVHPTSPYASLLTATNGVNVLCATCLPDHSQVMGRCIPCSSIDWSALCGVLVLATLAVYLIHRLPHDWSGSATLIIVAYFLQQSQLFLQNESLPQILSLINLNLIGDQLTRQSSTGTTSLYVGMCIIPTSDIGRLIMALVSPVIAVGLLGLVALIQLACSRMIQYNHAVASLSRNRMNNRCNSNRVYEFVFIPSPAVYSNAEREEAVSILQESIHEGSLRHTAALQLYPPLHDHVLASNFINGRQLNAPLLASQPASSALVSPDLQMSIPANAFSISLAYQRTLVRLLQLSYTSVCLLGLSFFRVQSVGQYGSRVVAYPTIDPNTNTVYAALLPIIILIMIVFVCGLPILFSIIVCREKRYQMCPRRNRTPPPVNEGTRSLTTARRCGWAKLSLLMQLCSPFLPTYPWMCVFLLIRRLLIVFVFIGVQSSTHVWIWLTGLNWCFLCLHVKLFPYQRRVDNLLETLTLTSLCLQTTLLSVFDSPYMTVALAGVLNALVIGPLLPAIGQVVYTMYAKCKMVLVDEHQDKDEAQLTIHNDGSTMQAEQRQRSPTHTARPSTEDEEL